jgi:hypothetical protein
MRENVSRHTSVGRWWQRKRTVAESVELTDATTVRRWLHDLTPGEDVTIVVHRWWGAIAVVASGADPVSVFLSEPEGTTFYAVAPRAPDDQHLTADQVERIVIDALTSIRPPDWPDWREL